tara:strand:- start:75 stop:473 length:399 start_codon:yes stop_codon:yes gene_type:complete
MKFDKLNLEDVIQVSVGASAFAVPVAFSEESWNLSRTLPWCNVAFIVFISLLFVALYAYQVIFQGEVKHRLGGFVTRILVDYMITALIVFIILIALNRMPILSEPIIALKRIIVLSFPASMGGVVIDGLDKE